MQVAKCTASASMNPLRLHSHRLADSPYPKVTFEPLQRRKSSTGYQFLQCFSANLKSDHRHCCKSKDISQGVVLEELVVSAFFVIFVGSTYGMHNMK